MIGKSMRFEIILYIIVPLIYCFIAFVIIVLLIFKEIVRYLF